MSIKNLLRVSALSAICLFATGCSDDDGYNADSAISNYVPEEYTKMVESVTTVIEDDGGREYVWTYEFLYDIKNRIQQIDGTMKYYYKGQLCNSTSTAKYRYNKALLTVEYVKEDVYPNKSDWNMTSKGSYKGGFNANGTLANFYTFDCEYSGMLFTKAYVDGGEEYAMEYDRFNNLVKAYRVDGNAPAVGTLKVYTYSPYKNKTNLDFASFFGYNIAERLVPANTSHNYAIFQLGAFGMFGSRSTNLPDGVWEFDSDGCPTKYTNSELKKTVLIKYKK
jgi:hypothetical protein